MRPDILIIGAGIIGLSIARELHKRGERNILLLDRSAAGTESSWAAAGMLSPQAEAGEFDTFFQFCCEARDLYPTFASELLDETGIDIELDRTGTLWLAFSERESEELAHRLERQNNGLAGIEKLTAAEIRTLEPDISEEVREGLFFANDWQVENRLVLRALMEYARRNGISVMEHTEAVKLVIRNGGAAGVETGDGIHFSERVIIAAGAWSSLIGPAKVRPIRGQMICFRPEGKPLRHVVYGAGGYLVPRRDGRLLAGATVEDVGFDKTVTSAAADSLRRTALEIVPALANLESSEIWSGLRPMAPDELPVLGCVPGIEHLTVATGHYRNGILLAPITAIVIADLLYGEEESPYLKAYSPGRFARRSAA